MKNLGQFFDYKRFFEGKKFVVTDNQPLQDFETKKILGRKIEVAIAEDNTKYIPSNSGSVQTNLFEKMKVKVLNDGKGNYDKVSAIGTGTKVVFSDFKKVNLWLNTSGKNAFMDLSIECYDCHSEIDVTKDVKK